MNILACLFWGVCAMTFLSLSCLILLAMIGMLAQYVHPFIGIFIFGVVGFGAMFYFVSR